MANNLQGKVDINQTGLGPLLAREPLLSEVDPIEAGNYRLQFTELNARDLFMAKRIFRDASAWGGFEIGQKLGRVLTSYGQLGEAAGVLLMPLFGIPEIEEQFLGWLGSLLLVTHTRTGSKKAGYGEFKPEPSPWMPLGVGGLTRISLTDLYPILNQLVHHPDFGSFFGQFQTQNKAMIDRLRTYLPKPEEVGSEESTTSSTDTAGTITESSPLGAADSSS
jgi:hypothetical protein